MPETTMTSLDIPGYGRKRLANTFFGQKGGSFTLAVVFPGVAYTCDMPLLYYPTLLLRQRDADVLQLHPDYASPAYRSLPTEERARWRENDAEKGLGAALAQGQYEVLILVGKSIGTLALAHLVGSDLTPKPMTIWLTPLLRQPQLVQAAIRFEGPALYIAGSADHTYEAGALARIQEATGAEALVIDGADHSLEIPGDAHGSLRALGEVLQRIDDFLRRHTGSSGGQTPPGER